MSLLRKLWDLWKVFGHVLGQVQTSILLAIIYHIGIGVLAVFVRLARQDLLQLTDQRSDSFAVALAPITTTLDRAQKQF